MRSRSLACLAVLLLACPSKSSETEGDDAGSSEPTAGSSETAPTTTMTTTTTTTGETGVTVAPTTTTTGEPIEPLPAACEELCAAASACGLGFGPQCVDDCVDGEPAGSECAPLLAELWSCVAALPCDDLQQQLEVEPHMCLEQVEAHDQCGIPDCAVTANGNEDACFMRRACEGVVQELRCEGDTCTCIEDGVPGQTCAKEEQCTNFPPAIPEVHVKECCQWQWL